VPYRSKSKRCPGCGRTHQAETVKCPACKASAPARASRPSASSRGYGHGWRKTRAAVLRKHGIPRDQWHLYDVDHNPPYNPTVEPNHSAYTLIPRLKSAHSSKTATEDTPRDSLGRFSCKGGGIKSLQNTHIDRGVQVSLCDVNIKVGGSE